MLMAKRVFPVQFVSGLILALVLVAGCLVGCKAPSVPPGEPPIPVKAPPANATSSTPAPAAELPRADGKQLTLFCGSAGRLPIEEIATEFEKLTGAKLGRSYGGSGTVLSQAMLAKKGDVYIPGSDDFMDKGEKKDVIVAGTRQIACYLVPVIAVQKGNPKGIKTVADFAKPGVRVGIGVPKAVCLGDIALEVFGKLGVTDKVKPNILTHADSCGAVATLLKLKQIDATIGWDVFATESPEDIEIIPLPAGTTARRNIPGAVFTFSKEQDLAREFVNYMATSEFSRQAFKKHGFTVE
jgi:molybdate transport system substrate-binding protein